MDLVEVCLYAVNVSVVGIPDYQDIIKVAEVCCNFVFFLDRCARWVSSRCCRKNSTIMPEGGAPMARPSFWMRIFPLLEK